MLVVNFFQVSQIDISYCKSDVTLVVLFYTQFLFSLFFIYYFRHKISLSLISLFFTLFTHYLVYILCKLFNISCFLFMYVFFLLHQGFLFSLVCVSNYSSVVKMYSLLYFLYSSEKHTFTVRRHNSRCFVHLSAHGEIMILVYLVSWVLFSLSFLRLIFFRSFEALRAKCCEAQLVMSIAFLLIILLNDIHYILASNSRNFA